MVAWKYLEFFLFCPFPLNALNLKSNMLWILIFNSQFKFGINTSFSVISSILIFPQIGHLIVDSWRVLLDICGKMFCKR